MLALGLDLSLTGTGIAHIDGRRTQRLDTPAARMKGHERLDFILYHVSQALAGAHLDNDVTLIVGIERPFLNPRNPGVSQELYALFSHVTHHLWTVDVGYVVIPPASLKSYATGKGGAGKDDMVAAAALHLGYPHDISDDEADAAWLRAAVLHHYGRVSPSPISFPADRIDVLDDLEWPTR